MKLSNLLINLRKPAELDKDLLRLETQLYTAFPPMEPKPEYVISLRNNLLRQISKSELEPTQPQDKILQTGLLVTGGVIGSFFVVLTGVRGFISLVGVLGLLISWIKQNSQESLTPPDLAV